MSSTSRTSGRGLALSIAFVALGSACSWEPIWPDPPDGGTGSTDTGVIFIFVDAGVPPDTGITPPPPDAGVTDIGQPYTFVQHVEPLLQVHCQTCHGNPLRFGATRPLVTYEDTQVRSASGSRVYELMGMRVASETHRMPPPSAPTQLNSAEVDVISTWARTGAPRGMLPESPYTWYRDVEPIVREYCQLCHLDPPVFGAPRPFVTYQDTQLLHPTEGIPIHELMAFRVVAPANRMPPPAQPQPSSEQVEVIRTWSQYGAPAGTPVDAGIPDSGWDAGPPDTGPGVPWRDGGVSDPPVEEGRRWIDTHAAAPTGGPYDPPITDTNYVCWSYPVNQNPALPPGQGEFAVYYEPILDNSANIHHMMLFLDDSGILPLNAGVVGPFACPGFPFEGQQSGPEYADFIGGWFPGWLPQAMPPGVGMAMEPGDRIIIQNHYDAVTTAGNFDESGLRVQLDSDTNYTPAGLLWAGVVWNGILNGPSQRTGTCMIQDPITVFQSFPHMHQYGTRIVSDVRRNGQANWTVISEINPWNFRDQPILPVPQAMRQLRVGDELRTRCYWDTQGNQVRQGDASTDEMCFNIFYHYPVHRNPGPGQGGCVVFSN